MIPIQDSVGRMTRGLGLPALALAATLCFGCGDDDSNGGDSGTDTDTDTDTDTNADGGADAGDNYDAEILWAEHSGAIHAEVSFDVAALSDDSVVVTGWFEYDTIFGDGEATETTVDSEANGGMDMYLARYAPDGAFQWVKHQSVGTGWRLAALPGDDFAVVGVYAGFSFVLGEGEANETELTDTSNMDTNLFVAVFHPDGSLVWAKSIVTDISDNPGGIAVGPDGSLYIVGYFNETALFGSGEENETELVTSDEFFDGFVAKYSVDGAFLWAKPITGEDHEYASRIEPAPDGTLWVVGSFAGSALLGAGEENETLLESAGDRDVFIAKYDEDGALQLAVQAGGTLRDGVLGVAASADGSAIVAGHMEGVCTFGAGEENETELASYGATDLFLAKYEADGTVAWAMAIGGAGDEWPKALTASADGSTVLVGAFADSIMLGDSPYGPVELTSASGDGIFAAKYDATGAVAWATEMEIEPHGYDYMGAVSGSDASTYVCGSFTNTCTIGVGDPGEVSMTADSGEFPPPTASDRLLIKIAP